MLTDLNHRTTPLTDEENAALYYRIRSGDKAAISEMIERSIPGVISRVGEFLRLYSRFSYLRDDLVSEGFMALTKTVNSFTVTEAEKHPSGRIVFEIDRALGSYADTEVGSGIMSERSVRRHRANGKTLPSQLPHDPNHLPVGLWFQADGRVIHRLVVTRTGADFIEPDRAVEITPTPGLSSGEAKQLIDSNNQSDGVRENDLLDEIMACCQCEEDEMIVNLRIKGYTDDEIGEQLGLSQQTINLRRKTIEARYQDRQ